MLLRFRRFVAGLAAVLVLVLAGSGTAHAAVQLNGTYSYWFWPSTSTGYYNMDQQVQIVDHTAGTHYFWAHSWAFIGGDQGYLGLQVGSFPNNSKIALFSIWGANGASGPRCGTFEELGEPGYTCRLDPYNWVTGRNYRLRIWVVGADSAGEWWGAWVQDTVTGVDSYVGKIRVPAPWGWLDSWSVSFTEYFGPPANTCAQIPYAFAGFAIPTANGSAVGISTHQHVIGSGSCPQYARVIDFGGDLHEQGKLR